MHLPPPPHAHSRSRDSSPRDSSSLQSKHSLGSLPPTHLKGDGRTGKVSCRGRRICRMFVRSAPHGRETGSGGVALWTGDLHLRGEKQGRGEERNGETLGVEGRPGGDGGPGGALGSSSLESRKIRQASHTDLRGHCIL